MSPRSRWTSSSNASGPSRSSRACSWIWPLASRRSRKAALPWPRRAIRRPATRWRESVSIPGRQPLVGGPDLADLLAVGELVRERARSPASRRRSSFCAALVEEVAGGPAQSSAVRRSVRLAHRDARSLDRTPEVGRPVAARSLSSRRDLEGGPVAQQRLAEAELVAVVEQAPPLDPLAVDEAAVAREALVDQHPLDPHPPQLGVDAGDVLVPGEDDVGGEAAPDRHLRPGVGQREDALAPVRVAVDQVGVAAALGLGQLALLGLRWHARNWTTAARRPQAAGRPGA